MKIRTGFVTNSSSSSFIVLFNTMPTTADEMKKTLFGDDEYLSTYDNHVSAQQAAEQIFSDATRNYNLDTIVDDLYSEIIDFTGDYDNDLQYDHSPESFIPKFIKISEFLSKKLGTAIDETNINNLRIFSYGDEDGSFYSCLENGGTFDNVPSMRISHH